MHFICPASLLLGIQLISSRFASGGGNTLNDCDDHKVITIWEVDHKTLNGRTMNNSAQSRLENLRRKPSAATCKLADWLRVTCLTRSASARGLLTPPFCIVCFADFQTEAVFLPWYHCCFAFVRPPRKTAHGTWSAKCYRQAFIYK